MGPCSAQGVGGTRVWPKDWAVAPIVLSGVSWAWVCLAHRGSCPVVAVSGRPCPVAEPRPLLRARKHSTKAKAEGS